MQQIEILELSVNEAKEKIRLRNDLNSLRSNRAFQRIIQNGFLNERPAELVRSLADPVISGDAVKFAEVQRELAGISTLHGYLNRVDVLGSMAERDLKALDEELEELRISGPSEE